MAPEEVEQSAFGDVARILQVLLDISDPFGIGAWLKFSAAGSEDCEDHEDFQTCKALNWSSGFHSGFEHLSLRCSFLYVCIHQGMNIEYILAFSIKLC